MASSFTYRFSARAEADFDSIIAYIALDLANPQAATDFADHLQDAIDEACAFPHSGTPVVNEFLVNKNVRMKVIDNYIMYYMPDLTANIIYIVRIVYGRRNVAEIFRQLD